MLILHCRMDRNAVWTGMPYGPDCRTDRIAVRTGLPYGPADPDGCQTVVVQATCDSLVARRPSCRSGVWQSCPRTVAGHQFRADLPPRVDAGAERIRQQIPV